MKFRKKRDEWGNALCFFRQASDVMQDAFKDKEKQNDMIFLAEVIVGSSLNVQSDSAKLTIQSLVTPPYDDRYEKYDSVTHEDMIAVYSNTKCYPRYLITY